MSESSDKGDLVKLSLLCSQLGIRDQIDAPERKDMLNSLIATVKMQKGVSSSDDFIFHIPTIEKSTIEARLVPNWVIQPGGKREYKITISPADGSISRSEIRTLENTARNLEDLLGHPVYITGSVQEDLKNR